MVSSSISKRKILAILSFARGFHGNPFGTFLRCVDIRTVSDIGGGKNLNMSGQMKIRRPNDKRHTRTFKTT